ncbi:ATP-binding protein, partial [Serratia rubidaea]|nr:two-component sensor histidine kinase [Serratia rubidaea]
TGGTGLGLAIAAQLASQMAGTLTLRNQPQGGLDACVTLREITPP